MHDNRDFDVFRRNTVRHMHIDEARGAFKTGVALAFFCSLGHIERNHKFGIRRQSSHAFYRRVRAVVCKHWPIVKRRHILRRCWSD